MTDAVERSCEISPCGDYRYWLKRTWGPGPSVVFVMLNPSTGDAEQDDPTIRRCIGYAKDWGYGSLILVNLYALRSRNPKDLWKAADPVGPLNDSWLVEITDEAAKAGSHVIAAWGNNAKADRITAARALPAMSRLFALHVTKQGQPGHPLFLKGDLVPFLLPAGRIPKGVER